MQQKTTRKRPLLKYFAITYLIFFVLFGLTGAAIAFELPQIIPDALQVVCAWSPTFAFLILYKELIPDLTLREFIKRQFAAKVVISQLFTVLGIQLLVLIGITLLVSATNKLPIQAVINTSLSALALSFINQLIRGPLGEEIGWRGYALNELQKKHSPLTSSLILGAVWGFWHTPLWFIMGYAGGQLLAYIALFLTGIIATSILITYFYNQSKNLLYPIIIHQLLNYSGYVVNADGLQVMMYLSMLYLVVAVVLVIANPRKALR